MRIDNIIGQMTPINKGNKNIENEKISSFGDVLKDKLDKVNHMQINADVATEKLITGENQDLHEVIIATEEARLALEMAVQFRNKFIEAYQEINRMQV